MIKNKLLRCHTSPNSASLLFLKLDIKTEPKNYIHFLPALLCLKE